MKNIISLKKISKSFTDGIIPKTQKVLQEISFGIHEGETVAILGPNGAGKTTTIKLIMGFLFPDEGDISIFGYPAGDVTALQKLGYVSDHPNFYEYLTGYEFLKYCGELHGLSADATEKAIRLYSEKMNIAYALDKKLRSYSRGMGQRLNMVQALLHDPPCIILDEPLNGLDPVGRKLFRDLLFELKQKEKTIFLSSHILEDIEALADRVILLKKGRILFDGELSGLKSKIEVSYQIIFKLSHLQLTEWADTERKLKLEKVDTEIWKAENILPTFLNEFISRLYSVGAEILSIEKLEPSLEDIFFEKYESEDEL